MPAQRGLVSQSARKATAAAVGSWPGFGLCEWLRPLVRMGVTQDGRGRRRSGLPARVRLCLGRPAYGRSWCRTCRGLCAGALCAEAAAQPEVRLAGVAEALLLH